MTINKSGLEYALTADFTHELVRVCMNCYKRGVNRSDVHDISLWRVITVLSGEDDLSKFPPAEINGFIADNWDDVNLIMSRYEKEFDAIVTGGFNLVNPGQVGEA